MGEPKDPETEGQPKPYAELGGLNDAIAERRKAAGETASEEAAAKEAAPEAETAEAVADTSATAPTNAAATAATAGSTASPVEARRPNAAPPPEPVAAKSAASGWLALLLGLLVGAVGILLVGPSLAPHLPRPIAEFLTIRGAGPDPAVVALETRLVAVETAKAEVLPDVSEDIAVLGGRLDAIAEDIATLSERADALGEDIAGLSSQAESLSEDVANLAAADADFAEDVQSLAAAGAASREDFEALHKRILTLETTSNPTELTERVNALEAEEPEVTGTEFAGLAETVQGANDRIDAIESGLEEARAKQAEAEAALEQARAAAVQRENVARLRAGGEALRARLTAGDDFGTLLSDLSTLASAEAPAALSDASGGVVTTDVLGEQFPSVAQAAMRAELAATGESTGAVFGWLQSQVTVRNTTPREGDDVEAVLSRVGAAIENGDANTALAESAGLPDHARDAMAGWLSDLETRVGAETALDNWLAEIGAADNG